MRLAVVLKLKVRPFEGNGFWNYCKTVALIGNSVIVAVIDLESALRYGVRPHILALDASLRASDLVGGNKSVGSERERRVLVAVGLGDAVGGDF